MPTFTGTANNDSLEGTDSEDSISGLGGNDMLFGGPGRDSLYGGVGNDTLEGGADHDWILGGTGDDAIFGDRAGGGVQGNDTLFGDAGNDTIIGDGGNDLIFGLADDDQLNGGSGDDTVLGGYGNDLIQIGQGGGRAEGNQGFDTLVADFQDQTAGISFQSNTASVFRGATILFRQTGFEVFQLFGTAASDYFSGGAGDDTLRGGFGPGEDTLEGNDGNDFISLLLEAGHSFANGQNGQDTLHLSLDFPTGIDFHASRDDVISAGNVILSQTGFEHWNIYGSDTADTIIGGDGADSLHGGGRGTDGGLDSIVGGGGNDTISTTGRGTVSGGAGLDTLSAYFSNRAGNVRFSATLPEVTSGGVGFLTHSGFEFYYIFGSPHDDTLSTGSQNDTIFGNNGNDSLVGGGGHDSLDGGFGVDTMAGGTGNDTYFVYGADLIREIAGQGTDLAIANSSFTLPANVENLQQSIGNGTGNELANTVTGSSGPNILAGAEGNDTLAGREDNDVLRGGAGNDKLIGAELVNYLGAHYGRDEIDTLTGNDGADWFVLGVAASLLYQESSNTNPGFVDYALITDFTPAQNDRLQLKGSAAQYFLADSPLGAVPGKSLYFDTNGNGLVNPGSDEMIAILRSPVTLNAANTIANAIFV